MNRLKSVLKRLLFPPPALSLLLAVFSAGLLICIFSAGLDETALAYAAYALSFYALVIVCAAVPNAFAFGARARENPHVDRFVSDYEFRTRTMLLLGLFFNQAFAVFKFAAGCLYASYWLIALGFYYAVLALMRFLLLRMLSRDGATPGASGLLAHYRTYRLTGAMMFILSIGMTAIIFQVIRDNQTYNYPGTLIYAFGAYAFYKITMAIVNLIRRRRQTEPLLAAARFLNLGVAMMSIFSLQTALLSTFGGDTPGFRLVCNAASGSVICVGMLLIAIAMVVKSSRAISALRIHNS